MSKSSPLAACIVSTRTVLPAGYSENSNSRAKEMNSSNPARPCHAESNSDAATSSSSTRAVANGICSEIHFLNEVSEELHEIQFRGFGLASSDETDQGRRPRTSPKESSAGARRRRHRSDARRTATARGAPPRHRCPDRGRCAPRMWRATLLGAGPRSHRGCGCWFGQGRRTTIPSPEGQPHELIVQLPRRGRLCFPPRKYRGDAS